MGHNGLAIRPWCIGMLVAVGLAFAGFAGTAAAQTLPPEIEIALSRAAAHDRDIAANLGPSIDERRRGGARHLETAILGIIAERPGLLGPAISRAVALLPSARDGLVAKVSASFPGFAAQARQAALAPAGSTVSQPTSAEPTPVIRSVRATTSEQTTQAHGYKGDVPPALRPAGWPVLPSEGGADGYAEIDPLEGLNRVFFYVNGALDFLVFEPLAKVYGYVMPDFAKPHIRQAFNNLGEPIVFANDLLQFRFHNAATTFSRFVINSTVGVAGLFDVATDLGLPAHTADFGQTLHSYGVGDGMYLVLPLFGPTSARDAVGIGVDFLLDPRTWTLDSNTRLGLGVGEGMVRREAIIDPVDFLVEHAEDPYEAVRAWTWQQRQRELEQACEEPVVTICVAPGG